MPKAPSGHLRVRTLAGVSPKRETVVLLESLMLLRVVYLAVLGAQLGSSPGSPVSRAGAPQSCMYICRTLGLTKQELERQIL